MVTVIYVEDELELRQNVVAHLQFCGYRAFGYKTAEDLLASGQSTYSDIVLVDLKLPGIDGMDLIGKIRSQSNVPIVVISGIGDESTICSGLSQGADDYIVKPFNLKVLVAKIEATLRRQQIAALYTPNMLKTGNLELDLLQHKAKVNQTLLALTPLEEQLLVALMTCPGRVISKKQLLQEIWGYPEDADTHVVGEVNRRLRKKLIEAKATVAIHTLWGRGLYLGDLEASL